MSLLVLTLFYLHNASDVHVVAQEAERLLCSQTDRQRSLTLRRLHVWMETIMLTIKRTDMSEHIMSLEEPPGNRVCCMMLLDGRGCGGSISKTLGSAVYCDKHVKQFQKIHRKTYWDPWITIDIWLGDFSKQFKTTAECNIWIPRHFIDRCDTPHELEYKSKPETVRDALISIVPECKPYRSFWVCLRNYLNGPWCIYIYVYAQRT